MEVGTGNDALTHHDKEINYSGRVLDDQGMGFDFCQAEVSFFFPTASKLALGLIQWIPRVKRLVHEADRQSLDSI
jgi:hypothetical protein